MGLTRDRHAINVTPLIDVLLVLLVIFLVVMPMMVRVETVDIPRKADSGEAPSLPVLVIAVKADLSVALEDEDANVAVSPRDLPAQLRTHLRGVPHLVFVDFEDAVPWNEVIATVDLVKSVASENHVAVRVRQ